MSKLNEVLKTVERLWPYLDQQTQAGVLALVREYGPKLAAAEGGGLPGSVVQEMTRTVDDKLILDIVNDLRRGPGEPGWIKRDGPSEPVVRGSGWTKPTEFPDRSRQFEVFDEMVARMVGGPNRPVK